MFDQADRLFFRLSGVASTRPCRCRSVVRCLPHCKPQHTRALVQVRDIMFRFWTVLILCSGMSAAPAFAQRGLKDVPDPDPSKQQASFQVAEGFEVNLFAAEPQIAKPIQMNWDNQGRLWVATSETYPHIKPGQKPNDKIICLEDTDGDGVADKHTVFADGLLMPTAILPTNDGVYVGASTELLFFRDTDGDGKADEKRIVLSGFGTEDTHHVVHTLKRGPAGDIYFNQSIYTHSHLETPFGVRRLLAGGTWQMNPETIYLDVFCRGLINPWGLVFDQFGQAFETDGAGSQGINYVFPGSVMVTAHNAARTVAGLNPGQPKHCGLDILTGDHLPEGWAGRFVTNDFRGNRINSFELSRSGSGYASVQADNLLTSDYVSFRPVDVLMGPDGAIYVADWYNPIIQHGEVDFRDERRDHEHGRIWRIAPKDLPKLTRKMPADSSVKELLALLKDDEKWWRDAARAELMFRPESEVAGPVREWTEAQAQEAGQALLEGLWTLHRFGGAPQALLQAALNSDDAGVRSAAVRLAADEDVEDLLAIAKKAIADKHPQVQLEAVHALRDIRTAEALLICTQAIKADNDRFLEFSLWQTFRDTESVWLPQLQQNVQWQKLPANVLLTLANAAGSSAAIDPLLSLWSEGRIPGEQRPQLMELLASRGTPQQLQQVWEWAQTKDRNQPLAWLYVLNSSAERRRVKPNGDLNAVAEFVQSDDVTAAVLGCQLAGMWKVDGALDALQQTIASNAPAKKRRAAVLALAEFGPRFKAELQAIGAGQKHPELQVAGIEALVKVDINLASRLAVQVLVDDESADIGTVLDPILRRNNGPNALSKALQKAELPTETAIAGVRKANALPKKSPALVSAFQKAGSLGPVGKTMTPEQIQQLATAVVNNGSSARGELIFRRKKLQCLKCHAIGGAGGKVGPDLTSIGASAPVDYLIESLFLPNKKIKEGYHTLQIVTIDGLVKAGVPVLQNQDEVHLRNADGKVEVIPADDIDLSQISPVSLMPADLVASLSRDELMDLVRFLAALGKTGELVVAKQRFVRTWQVLAPGERIKEVNDFVRHNNPESVATQPQKLPWQTVYSRVVGSLDLSEVPVMGNVGGRNLQYARFEVEVATPGKIAFRIEQPQGVLMWAGDEEVAVDQTTLVPLEAGRHWITVAVDAKNRSSRQLQIEMIEAPEADGQAQLVN